ncbi:MAG TPA: peptide chain release factor N(5)-glutamine methyltransferase [Pyrinomonadaceae bacterium]|nr:peptide chain release factor N(5)-glutamine methyltransferase [Pyrinomonadaceae bacterium]
MTISIANAIREGVVIFQDAGLAEAQREAGGLLQHVLGRDRTFLLAHPEQQLTETQWQTFQELIRRRAAGEPLQYITALQSFFGLDFEVAPGVLIPRPETELLVELALETLQGLQTPRICDVGTGSGCIAVTLLHERTDAHAVAIDISAAALEIAKRNASRHSVERRLTFVQANCFSSLSPAEFSFDLIVSNPPYVAEEQLAGLQREVRDHEPREALAGGPDGLDVVRRLLTEASAFLKPGGHLLIEIGFNQAAAVTSLLEQHSWLAKGIRPDLQGIPRVVVLQKSLT